jgi:hypothetical protein
MALGYFYGDHPDLPGDMRSKILRRATSRAWRWAKRQEKKSMLSAEFKNYLQAKLGLFWPHPDKLIFDSCETFRRTSTIRFPKHVTHHP